MSKVSRGSSGVNWSPLTPSFFTYLDHLCSRLVAGICHFPPSLRVARASSLRASLLFTDGTLIGS